MLDALHVEESVEIIIAEEKRRCRIESAQIDARTSARSSIWEISVSGSPVPFYPFMPEFDRHYLYEITVALDTEALQWIITISNESDAAEGIRRTQSAFKAFLQQPYVSQAQFVQSLVRLAEGLYANNDFTSVSLTQGTGEKNEVLYTSSPVAAAASGSSGVSTQSRADLLAEVAEQMACSEALAMQQAMSASCRRRMRVTCNCSIQ